MFDLKAMQKKGSSAFGGSFNKGLDTVLIVVILGALAPTAFGTNWSAITGAPSFVGDIMPLLIAAAFIYLIYRQVK